MSKRRIGVCNLCEAICGLELTIEGRDVVGVRGNPADPLSRGHICPKGAACDDPPMSERSERSELLIKHSATCASCAHGAKRVRA